MENGEWAGDWKMKNGKWKLRGRMQINGEWERGMENGEWRINGELKIRNGE